MDFEVCIDSVEGAIAASHYGAKRVELCSALSEGGLTPSLAMIEACVNQSDSEVFVMIRPSAGGFVYSDHEIELMERDIIAAHNVGAHGVVFGVLKDSLEVDVKKNLFLIETALKLNLGTTFHRAIDVCPNPTKELEHLINLGFDRMLTSGGKPKAIEGIDMIRELHQQANGRIEVMAGSGVNPENTSQFLKSGIEAIHFTAHLKKKSQLPLDMGPEYTVNNEKIQRIAFQLNN